MPAVTEPPGLLMYRWHLCHDQVGHVIFHLANHEDHPGGLLDNDRYQPQIRRILDQLAHFRSKRVNTAQVDHVALSFSSIVRGRSQLFIDAGGQKASKANRSSGIL